MKRKIISGILLIASLTAVFLVLNSILGLVESSSVIIDGQNFAVSDRSVELYPMTENGFEEFSRFERLEELKIVPFTVQLKDNAAAELTGAELVAELKRIDESYPDHTDIEDISFLSDIDTLKVLNLHGCSFSDLSPVVGNTGLRELNISDTNVSDITLLASFDDLEKVDISDTSVTDLSPLLECNKMTRIYFTSLSSQNRAMLEKNGWIIDDENLTADRVL